MRAIRVPGLAVLSLAVLAACGSNAPASLRAAQRTSTPTPPAVAPFAAWVHLTTPAPSGTLELLTTDGRVLRRLPGGELFANDSRVLAAEPVGTSTRLRVLDAGTGAVLDERALPAGFHLPVLGPSRRPIALGDGDRFAALEDTPAGADTGTVPTTHLAVVDLARGGATRLVTLAGDFNVDALSADGSNLYLIESLKPDAAGRVDYRVRRVDVATGALYPHVVVDKTDGDAAMSGVPLSRVSDAPGWVLTLYGFGKHGSFVHELGVDAGIAVCLDLPADKRTGDDAEQLLWSIVRNPEGSLGFAINAGTGQVVELNMKDGGPPTLGRTADIPIASKTSTGGLVTNASAKRIVSTGAVLSPDGKTLYAVADTGILAVDVATLAVTKVLASGTRPSGLAISPAGDALLATEENGGTVDTIDVRNGATTSRELGGQQQVDLVLASVDLH